MLRPYHGTSYESDMYSSPFGDHYLEYRHEDVLKPDLITDGMAYIAASELNERTALGMHRKVGELGAGSAPFLTLTRQRTRQDIILDLSGCETSEAALPYALYNVGRAVKEHGNPADVIDLRSESWDAMLGRRSTAIDVAYFNPPYLSNGECVRDEFSKAPCQAMYIAEGLSPLYHYEHVLPMLRERLNPNGLALVRTPRERTWHGAVARLVASTFGQGFTIHDVAIQDELGDRSGGGLAVEAASAAPVRYVIEPVRCIGLALSRQPEFSASKTFLT